MSSRIEQKRQLKAERLERERAAAAQKQKRRLLGGAAGGGLALAAIGVLVFVAATGAGHGSPTPSTAAGSTPSTTSGSTPPTSQVAFGPHYATLDQRRQAVGVPTMMDTMNSPVHFHPVLSLWANGQQIAIPANIGIDPSKDSMAMAGLHTHDSSGTIHVEGVANATLGQFFAVWGVALSPTQMGPYHATGANAVRMWVDGHPSLAFGSLKLADGQHITITYGMSPTPPHA